jgi:threonine/homoserine/homoserine lactone efflux protein
MVSKLRSRACASGVLVAMWGVMDTAIWISVSSGVVLGLSGGIAPGPLTALVIRQTLRYGSREGIKVAFAPVLTDGPLVLAAWFAMGWLSDTALGVVSLLGAVFLVWMAWETARVGGVEVNATEQSAQSIRDSVLVNLLNPHPYLFWFVVGGPIVLDASRSGWVALVGFLAGFFGCLVGAKVALAMLVGRMRGALTGGGYTWTMRLLGLAILVFAVVFVRDGLGRLGITVF